MQLKAHPLGEKICQQLAAEIGKLGYPAAELPTPPVFADASFSQAKDPYSGVDSLVGVWRDGKGNRLGEIKLHGDGSFYAEYDVFRPHPSKQRWMVESVVAWGQDEVIKSEAKLMPAFE